MVERIAGRKAAARRTVHRRRLIAGGAAVVALCLAGGGVALADGRTPGPTYRTATAAVGSVAQTLAAVGSVASATRRDAAFSVAGTVGTVNVSVGQTVKAGAVLATLDPAALDDAVAKAQSTLVEAKQHLTDDLASQTAAATAAATAATATATAATASPTAAAIGAGASATASPSATAASTAAQSGRTPVDGVASAVAAVEHAQQALIAQDKLSAAALRASVTSASASHVTCTSFLAVSDGSTPTATPTATPTPTVVPTATAGPTASPTPTDGATTTAQALTACQQAISTVLVDQHSVDSAQTALLALAGALDDAVAASQKAVSAAQAATAAAASPAQSTTAQSTVAQSTTAQSTTAQSATTTQSTTTAGSSAAASGTGSQATSTQVPSAATILADQAAISLDEAKVSIAKNALTMVSLTSPIDGTVAAVSIAAGDTVSASSTTAVITVIGNDGYVVTTTVPLTAIDTVKVGQSAVITVASTSKALSGTVSSIGILNVSTSSDPSYTVVLAVATTTERLFNGSSAQVTVTTSQQAATLAVPSSAVHVAGSISTVRVLRAGKAVTVHVKTGAVGSELIEITSGLTKGDRVILANLSQKLASQEKSTTSSGLSSLGGTTGTTGTTGQTRGGPGGAPPGS